MMEMENLVQLLCNSSTLTQWKIDISATACWKLATANVLESSGNVLEDSSELRNVKLEVTLCKNVESAASCFVVVVEPQWKGLTLKSCISRTIASILANSSLK